MRNNNAKLKIGWSITIIAVIIFLLIPIGNTLAQDGYKVLAPLPGTTLGTCVNPGDAGCKTTLKQYLPGLFNLAIGIAIAFVLLNLVFGGFQYMSTDAFTKKNEGIKRIQNSIYGLLLVASAWIILFTINPDLINVNLEIKPTPIPTAGGATVPSDSCPPPHCVMIEGADISFSSRGSSVHNSIAPKLAILDNALDAAGINWTVTEAYPPSRPTCSTTITSSCHKNPCHANGTCIDADFFGNPTTAQIKTFMDEANKAGLRSVYEVKTTKERDDLRTALGPGYEIESYEHISGSHFSVYNK